ncbi:MAG: restriction endonuclease S [Thermodesulfobacteriota bacterium]|nr:MAG: restriction endonuclease S [Thermodesulfobacteriota bacterium]
MIERYLEKKDTGIIWLGKIPDTWQVVRLRFLCDITTGDKDTNDRKDDGIFPFYVRSQTVERISSFSFDGEAILTAGDGAGVCKVWHYTNGKFDYHQRVYMLSNFRSVTGAFLFYFLKENFIHEVLKLSAKSTVESLRRPMFLDFPVALPAIEEQVKIIEYLDYQTRLIDLLIEKKEKLLQLLKEHRQAVINEAVTKGLNPEVGMKDSGIVWLGEIPESWRLSKLNYLFEIKKNIAGELGYDVLSVTQKGLKVRDLDNLKGQLSMDYSKYQIVDEGDFVMNHMDLLTGYVDISKQEGVTSPDYRVFKLTKADCLPEYYLYLFQMGYKMKILFSYGRGVSQLGRWRLPATEFKNIFFPVPPLDEQKAIVEYLNNITNNIDQLLEKVTLAVNKLKEYRQSIISEAVTGKVDVRDWQPTTKVAL